MQKFSPKFYNYLLLIMLGLAFIFPLTHSTYEGMKIKEEVEEVDEGEEVDEEEQQEGYHD